LSFSGHFHAIRTFKDPTTYHANLPMDDRLLDY
jgi:hypothetical protein